MNISIGNLTITSYCSQNPEHKKFKWALAKDRFIYKFVSHTIIKDLQEVNNDEEIELDNSYIIEDKNKPIGYIYITAVPKEDGVVELRYAVHPKYRRLGYQGYHDSNRKGYGQQVLEECRDYLFTFDDVNNVELDIRIDNEVSMNCAEKAKYKCLGLEPDGKYYIYRASRKKDFHEN